MFLYCLVLCASLPITSFLFFFWVDFLDFQLGYTFGPDIVRRFLEDESLDLICRAHQACVSECMCVYVCVCLLLLLLLLLLCYVCLSYVYVRIRKIIDEKLNEFIFPSNFLCSQLCFFFFFSTLLLSTF